jgi:hypothetical protein
LITKERFDLSLTNGRHFCLQAGTSELCEEWVKVLNKCGGRNMAVLRLQQCWRHYWARQKFVEAFAKSKATRNKGVELIRHQRRGSTDASITRGPLKKKDYHGSTAVTKLWRNRFFVIDHKKGELRYYDNKTKEKIGYRPRTVQFIDLISVIHHKKTSGGRTFTVRVTNGRTYELSASKRLLAEKWVNSLLQLLPAENVAALKLQKHWRAHVSYKKYHSIIQANLKEKREAAEKSEKLKQQQLKKEAQLKKANEQAAARRNRLNRLTKVKAEQKKKPTGETKENSTATNKLSRLARLKAAKAAKEAKLKAEEEKKKAAEEAKRIAEEKAKTMFDEQNKSSLWTEYETEGKGKTWRGCII